VELWAVLAGVLVVLYLALLAELLRVQEVALLLGQLRGLLLEFYPVLLPEH
jgi:hypothetical protein